MLTPFALDARSLGVLEKVLKYLTINITCLI